MAKVYLVISCIIFTGIQLVPEPTNYKKLYHKEKEKNEILEKTNKYLFAKSENLEKTNKYLFAKNNILTNNKNKGEKDEVLLLIDLYHLNEMKDYDKLREIFGEDASEGISIHKIDTNDEIIDINKLSKAPSGYKADCKIRMKKTNKTYCISIKSKNGANPSILNHTPRTAKVFKETGALYNCVPFLDKILQEYNDKRINKIIGEDTPISNLRCLKEDSSLKENL